jgi:hypothetical protein
MKGILVLGGLFAFFLFTMFVAVAHAQNPPDAPSAAQPPIHGKVWTAFHSPWTYPNVPTKQVLSGKAFWATFLGDVAISSFDAEMSHAGLAHSGCRYEANGNKSRAELYRFNLPENAAVGVVSFIWLKVKGPKYVLPVFLARPAYVHIKAGLSWTPCF